MRTGPAALLLTATLDEDAWEDLLSFIEGWSGTSGGPGRDASSSALGFSPMRFVPPSREMPDHAVFVSYALDRARNMADGALFILPVSLDGTIPAEAHVPERFNALHFTQLPGGQVTPEFAGRLTEFLRGRS